MTHTSILALRFVPGWSAQGPSHPGDALSLFACVFVIIDVVFIIFVRRCRCRRPSTPFPCRRRRRRLDSTFFTFDVFLSSFRLDASVVVVVVVVTSRHNPLVCRRLVVLVVLVVVVVVVLRR